MSGIGGLFRRVREDETLVGRIRILEQDLQNIADVENMVRTTGWKKVRKALEDEIRQCEVTRFQLDEHPVKNEHQIIVLREFERSLSLVLNTIDGALSKKAELLKLRKEYEALARAADLDERHFASGSDS